MHDGGHEDVCVLYHAGELPAGRAAEFEAGLSRCAACRDLLESLRMASRLAARAAVRPPADLDDRVLLRLEASARGEGSSGAGLPAGTSPRRGLVALLAAACLAVALRAGSSRRSAEDLRWKSGLDGDIAAAVRELDGISWGVNLNSDPLEIDAEIRSLERDAEDLKRRVERIERL